MLIFPLTHWWWSHYYMMMNIVCAWWWFLFRATSSEKKMKSEEILKVSARDCFKTNSQTPFLCKNMSRSENYYLFQMKHRQKYADFKNAGYGGLTVEAAVCVRIAHNCMARVRPTSQRVVSHRIWWTIFHVDNCSVHSEWLTLSSDIIASDDIATITVYTKHEISSQNINY